MKTPRALIRLVLALALLLLVLSSPILANSPTYWPSGPLSGATTWTLAHSPFVVQLEVIAPAGMTPTVEAGQSSIPRTTASALVAP